TSPSAVRWPRSSASHSTWTHCSRRCGAPRLASSAPTGALEVPGHAERPATREGHGTEADPRLVADLRVVLADEAHQLIARHGMRAVRAGGDAQHRAAEHETAGPVEPGAQLRVPIVPAHRVAGVAAVDGEGADAHRDARDEEQRAAHAH